MAERLTIKEAEWKFPDMVKGQAWIGTQAKYWFRCLLPSGTRHPDYKQTYAHHASGQGCPPCGKKRIAAASRLPIEERESRYPDLVPGQVWKDARSNYLFKCLAGLGHPDYLQRFDHHEGHGCPRCGQIETQKANIAKAEASIARIMGKTVGCQKVLSLAPPTVKGKPRVYCRCTLCGHRSRLSVNNLIQAPPTMCLRCKMDDLHAFNQLRPYESLFNSFINSRRREGKIVSLAYEEFVEFTKQEKCHYCWAPLTWTKYNLTRGHNRYNLDRKDNNRGYEPGNLVVCCHRCNYGKGARYTYAEWYGMTAYFRVPVPIPLLTA